MYVHQFEFEVLEWFRILKNAKKNYFS